MDSYKVCKNCHFVVIAAGFSSKSKFFISLLNRGHIFTQFSDYVLLGGLYLLVFNEIFMYLPSIVQRVDSAID